MTSILPNEMRGVMYISGLRGVGKSYLAVQADAPENLCFLDFEEKGSGINKMMPLGKYKSLTSEAAKRYGATFKPIQLYDEIKRAFDEIESDRYTVLILDNISPFEEALKAEVKRNPQAYGIDPRKAESGSFGGASPGVHYLVSGYCNHAFSKGIRLAIAVAHTGNTWASGGIVPNKYRPKGVDRWQELSILSLVLIPGQFAPIPAALVQKEQLGLIQFNTEKQEHDIRRRLPLRLPKATFAEIRRYLKEPANLERPATGETPSEAERDPFSDKFSKEQLEYIGLSAKIEARKASENNGTTGAPTVGEPPAEPRTLTELLSKAQMSPDAIATLLNVPVVEVYTWSTKELASKAWERIQAAQTKAGQ